jgi:hypothetical protein
LLSSMDISGTLVFRDCVHGNGTWVDMVWTKECCTIWKAAPDNTSACKCC